MAYEKKNGDIAVFVVKDKRNPKGPDWTGTALLNGKEYQVSFWQKSPTFLAGQIKDKWVPPQTKKDDPPPADDDMGGQIPFD